MTREDWLTPPTYVPTLPNLYRRAAANYGAKAMIITDGRAMSFAEALQRSGEVARGLLAVGVGKGSRVGILMPNSPDWIVSFMAITRIGGIAVLISTLYQRSELGWVVRHADLQALMVADRYLRHDYLDRIEQIAPEIRSQAGAQPLFLEALPYLRQVFVWGETVPTWAVDARSLSAPGGKPSEALLAAVEENVAPADFALVMYTSGTTADPKGILHAHGPVVRRTSIGPGARSYTSETRLMVLGPFCWAAGFNTLFNSLHAGATLVSTLSPKLEDIAEAALAQDVTAISAQPAMLKRLDEHLAAIGATPGPGLATFLKGPMEDGDQPIPAERLSRGLGMTETVCMHSVELRGVMPPDKPNAFGRGVPDIERRIRDFDTGAWLPVGQEGELCVRGSGLLQGLYKKERHETFDADGFYGTGDVCRIDEDGFLYYRGRRGEMIKTAGANVSPREVELALEAYPEVQEAGVFALPGEGYDETVAAVVAPRGDARLDPEDLRARLRKELATFKVPKVLHVMAFEDLPRTGSGKLNKRALKEALTRKTSPESGT